MGALHQIVQQGKALYVGISNYQPEEARELSYFETTRHTCVIHQPSYSMMNRWIENGLQDVLDEEGIGSIAFSPLSKAF